MYLFSTDRVVVRLAPQQILPDVLQEWGLTYTYKSRPNSIQGRRAAEDGLPLPSNLNFSIQGEPPVSSLSPILPQVISHDIISTNNTNNDYVANHDLSNVISNSTTTVLSPPSLQGGAIDTTLSLIPLLPSQQEGAASPVSSDATSAISHNDDYHDISEPVASQDTSFPQPPTLRRQSARQQEGATRHFSQFRFADPTSTRAQSRYSRSIENIDFSVPDEVVSALRLSVKKGLASDKRSQVHLAITAELTNMLITHSSLQAISYNDIPFEHRDRIMVLHMFLKQKFNPAGNFIKMKARLVMGGDKQHPDSYSDLASPTVNPLTLMTIFNLIAVENSECATFDVPAAFLVPPMPDSEHFYGVLDPLCSSIAIEIDPSLAPFRTSNGRLYFRLRKYLYGLKQASIKFYAYLMAYFTDLQFTQSTLDPCLFTKHYPAGIITVVFHVDDILLKSPNPALLNKYASHLKHDLNVEQHFTSPFSFIAMTMTRDRKKRTVKLTMGALTDKLIDQYAAHLPAAVTPFDSMSHRRSNYRSRLCHSI